MWFFTGSLTGFQIDFSNVDTVCQCDVNMVSVRCQCSFNLIEPSNQVYDFNKIKQNNGSNFWKIVVFRVVRTF